MKLTKTTKTLLLLLIAFGGIFMASCDPKKLQVKFDMDYSDVEMTLIPDTFTTGTVVLTFPVNSSLEQSLQQNGASKDNIKSIKIKESRLDISSPSTGNFDFLGSFIEFIGPDSINFAKVAEKLIVPMGVNTLPLDVTPGNDISEALKSEKFYLQVRTSKRGPITDTLKIKTFMKFEVVAELD